MRQVENVIRNFPTVATTELGISQGVLSQSTTTSDCRNEKIHGIPLRALYCFNDLPTGLSCWKKHGGAVNGAVDNFPA
jgi:hypothetical protein